MLLLNCLSLITLLLTISSQAASVTDRCEGLPAEIKIWLPEKWHTQEKAGHIDSWPVIIYYHGTHGQPTVDYLRFATQQTGFILVGTTYIKRGRLTYSPENIQAERDHLKQLRTFLSKKYRVDDQRVYIAGFSKGGWSTSMFLERESDLAGGLILGGGIFQPLDPPKQLPKAADQAQIYIGVGRYDGNYPESLKALVHFRKRNHPVTLDVWPDIGHSMPRKRSQRLSQWLALRSNDPPSEAFIKSWANEEWQTLLKQEDSIRKWLAMEDFKTFPYIEKYEKNRISSIDTELNRLAEIETIAQELKIRKALRSISREEIKNRYVSTLKKVHSRYAALAEKAPKNAYFTQEAIRDEERTRKLLEHTH